MTITGVEVRDSSLAELKPLIRASFPLGLRASLAVASAIMPGISCTLALVDDRPAGCIIVRRGARQWEIVSTVVLPDYRRLGIAAALVRRVIDDATGADAEIVAFVRKSNRPSRMLCHAMGFRVEKVWSFPFCFEEILPWADHFVWRRSHKL
ncbi:MAG: GNAT family N-acetyltransferase [Candidatus Hydrogenedentota bacterium]